MAKIRGVKPDYWTDEDIVELSIPARLLFIGLWNYACDNGHLQDKPKQIKMRILPSDDVNCSELLREIEAKGCIRRDADWITIPNLAHHQKPDRRYFLTCDHPNCEPPPETVSQRKARRVHVVHTPGTPSAHDVGTPSAHGDGDGDGDGDGELKVITALPANAGKKQTRRATQRPADFRPSQAHIDLATERGVDLHAEWAKFCDWSDANGKTYKDWPAALRNWIRNARPTMAAANQPSRVQQHLALARQLAEAERPHLEIGDPR
jgi:hypothetical protein